MSNEHSVTDRRKALLRRRLEQQGLVSETRRGTAAREPGARYPLSPGQQRMWFLQQLEPTGTTLNICVAYTIEGELDAGRLGDALATVHARHDILRTTYHAGPDGEPYLTIAEAVGPAWATHDIAGLDDAARIRRLEVLARREFARPFDLAIDLPLRTTLVRTGPASHTLVLVVHHIAWDDDCWDPFFADLSAAYADALPATRDGVAQHLDLTVLDRTGTASADADDIAYWRGHLSTPPEPLELPGENGITALPDPAAGHASTRLPAGLLDEVRDLARAQGATTFMALLAAFDALVYRYTGTADFLVATPVVDRPAGAERALGYFGNTLALRATVAPTDTFRTLVAAARTEAGGAFAHQGVGVDRLVAAVAPDRRDGLANLARLSFAARTGGGAGLDVPGLTTRRADLRAAVAQVPLGLMVEWSESGAVVEAEYLTEVLERPVVENLLAHYVRLLDALVHRPDEPLRTLDMLGDEDRARLRALATGDRFAAAAVTLPALVQAQVARTPGAVALVADDVEITFDELDRRANRVAHWLVSRGVGPEDLVALSFGRSVDMVVIAYGVLKAGAAYVPVDPTYPADRIAYMLSDAAPTVALSADDDVEDLARGFPDTTPTDADRVRPLHLDNLAYVIYTSGSTGTPKGVPVPHGAIVEYLDWLRDEYAEGPEDSLLQVASTSFDVSVGEMFGTLAGGARLVIPKPDGLEDIPYLTDLLLSKKVSAMHFVPSLLGLFLMLPGVSEWTSLRRIPIGGEPLPGELADKFRATFDAKLHNFYGPTETVLASTRYKIESPQGVRIVPIGRPKINTEVHLLDEGLQPVPVGVIGEVYIGGSQLARGYLRRPALTAERFVADPFTPGGRLYRTGDVARWNIDGDIEFIGRADEQVKIRGFRIELGEVQAAVTAHPAVDACVVVATETPTLGKILVAYVVGSPTVDGAPIDLDAVRGVAAAGLPEYMVPTAIVAVDAIPLTANGKLDRDALPEPTLAPRAASRAPSTETETMLCAAFAAALGVESVGVDDSFFELGGHSLLATRLVSRLRAELGVELSIREAFDAPTVAGLAALIDAKIAAAETVRRKPLTRAVREERIPLSYAQLRQWFLYRLEGPNPTYNIPFAARLAGPVNPAALVAALADVVGRHEALRTTFPDENGTPYQAINNLDHAAIAAAVRVRDLAPGESIAEVLAAARDHCFDLDVDVPIRAEIVGVGEQEWVLSVVIHHIAGDEWSAPVLFGDLLTAYTARLDGAPPAWDEPEIQYADYALWQRDMLEAEGEHQIDYWRKQLDGVPEDTTVLRDRTRPAVASARGVTVPFTVSPEVRAGLTGLARDIGASEFMVLEAAVAVLLSRLGAGLDIPLGTPIAGRNEAALSDLVGFFVNTIVLRNDLAGDPTLREIVARVRRTALDAYAHQDLPFERLVDALNPERSLSLHPLFQVLVHLRESGEFSETIAGGARFSTITPEFDTVKFDLGFDFYPDGEGYGGGIAYRSELYDPETIDTLVRRVELVLRALAFAADTRLSEVDVLGAEERTAALGARSDGGGPVPGTVGTIPEVLAQSRSHTGTAVVCAGEEIGYPELHERSDRLAALLVARGAGPERFVGIAVPRSIDMMVALLAVIKTGAGFLPLDLRYPRQRLELMITDAAPVVVLTTVAAQRDLPVVGSSPALAFDADDVVAELETVTVGEFAAPGPDNVAYFLFTSGSTGLPKGVLGTQRGFANRVCWQPVRYPVAAPDVRLAQGALSFLDSPLELIAALAAGAKLVLADDREARDLTALAELLRQYPIAQVTAVASAVSALIEIAPESVATVRRWVCSGEPMTASLLARLSAVAPNGEIVNSYGTTETSGANVRGTMTPERVRVGSPVPGVRVLLLDERLQPTPIGVTGEVYVAGAQLSRGYWNRFGLTSGRFIANPYPAMPGERIYRTGDRARWNNQGEMEFGGRVDHQVNVRGFRIELGEVEAALRAAPGVVLAAARVHEIDGAPAIAAYVTTADPDVDEASFVATVRAHIASQLPGYMLPATVTLLETMPLTGSGKLNRPALPAPKVVTSGEFAPPVTDTERTLATVLEEVLGVSPVGRADGFFALGGDSIVSIQFAARARSMGLELTPQMVFENPTVAELADALDRGATAAAQDVAQSAPMSASGLDDDALAALQASWNSNR